MSVTIHPVVSRSKKLHAYDPGTSDGCSLAPFLPRVLRVPFQKWAIRVIANNDERSWLFHRACIEHDCSYYYGGTKEDRKDADERLRIMLIRAGATAAFATSVYRSIRFFGGPGWRQPQVSWAFGGDFFEYGPKLNGE